MPWSEPRPQEHVCGGTSPALPQWEAPENHPSGPDLPFCISMCQRAHSEPLRQQAGSPAAPQRQCHPRPPQRCRPFVRESWLTSPASEGRHLLHGLKFGKTCVQTGKCGSPARETVSSVGLCLVATVPNSGTSHRYPCPVAGLLRSSTSAPSTGQPTRLLLQSKAPLFHLQSSEDMGMVGPSTPGPPHRALPPAVAHCMSFWQQRPTPGASGR